MAQKASIEANSQIPPPARFENALGDQDVEGIRPILQSPQEVIKTAIRRSVLICLISITVTAGAIYFAYLNISKNAADLQNKQDLVYEASQQGQTNSNMLRMWQVIGPKYAALDNLLPSPSDLLSYTGVLEKIAGSSGVTQNVQLATPSATSANLPSTSANLSTVDTAAKGSSIDYSINLSGNLTQIISYINQLENAPFLTQIISMNLNGSQGLEQNSTGTVGAKVYTYP